MYLILKIDGLTSFCHNEKRKIFIRNGTLCLKKLPTNMKGVSGSRAGQSMTKFYIVKGCMPECAVGIWGQIMSITGISKEKCIESLLKQGKTKTKSQT